MGLIPSFDRNAPQTIQLKILPAYREYHGVVVRIGSALVIDRRQILYVYVLGISRPRSVPCIYVRLSALPEDCSGPMTSHFNKNSRNTVPDGGIPSWTKYYIFLVVYMDEHFVVESCLGKFKARGIAKAGMLEGPASLSFHP